MELIQNFIRFLERNDIAPAPNEKIIADDKAYYYKLACDKAGKRGSYSLMIDGDMAIGWAHDHRIGKTYKYTSRAPGGLSEQEKQEYAKRRDEARRIRDEQESRDQEAAAKEAARIWAEARPCVAHDYIKNKGLSSAHGCRVSANGMLLIRMFAGGKLWGLQQITPQGDKYFLTGARKKGCYAALAGQDDDKSVIVICEGFATAASLREATGLVVVAAFDCGNLEPVTREMRRKYPDARLIIAADNDQWRLSAKGRAQPALRDAPQDDPRWDEWRDAGYLENIGVIKAKAAALKVGAHVIIPDVPFTDKHKRTDWNDIAASEGLDKVQEAVDNVLRARLSAISSQSPQDTEGLSGVAVYDGDPVSFKEWWDEHPPIESYDDEVRDNVELYLGQEIEGFSFDPDWQDKTIRDDKGKLKSNSLVNVGLILDNSPKFRNLFCYDEFADEKVVVQCPPWEDPARFKPRVLTEEDNTQLCMTLERHGITVSMQNVRKVLDAVIMKRPKNPAKEYFNSLQWDGQHRLDCWLKYYADAKADPDEYLQFVGTKWLVAAVQRVFKPGSKFEHILIFEGDQGTGKSTMLRELSTIYGRSYFDDTIKVNDLGQKDTVPKLQGVLIIELQEMSGLRKAGVQELKQQISIQEDRIVKKWSNEPTRFPRKFIFGGTINPVNGYLEDPTGDRRFWPVAAGNNVNIEALQRDKEQLWAEAVHLYKSGFRTWMNNEERDLLYKVQESRKIVAPWKPDLEELISGKSFVMTKQVWEACGFFQKERRTRRDYDTISGVMRELGFISKRKMIDGQREYGFERIA